MTVSITIERDGCIECGACMDACGEIFELPNGEKARVVAAHQEGSEDKGTAEDGLLACARSAEDACPVSIISVNQ